VAPGADSGKLTLTDNDLNVAGAQQNILLNGTGIAQDFSLTANPASITIETQHHGTMQLTLTSIGSFAGPVYLGCQGPLPPYVTCELPASETLAAGQTLNFNFTMDTDAVLNFLAESSPAAKTPWGSAPGRMALALLLPLGLAGLARRRQLLRRLLLLAVLVVGATGLTACGDKWPAHTPPGTYTIPVVATGTTSYGNALSHTLNITLTVTP
jgi:predicted small lipoprotein YifL